MNSTPKTSSPHFRAQESLRFPILAQVTQKYLCIPTSGAILEQGFSKEGHIVEQDGKNHLMSTFMRSSFVLELGIDGLGAKFSKICTRFIVENL